MPYALFKDGVQISDRYETRPELVENMDIDEILAFAREYHADRLLDDIYKIKEVKDESDN